MEMKVCSKCSQGKIMSEFVIKRSCKDGFSSYCRACKAKYNKEHYKNNKDEYKNRALERKRRLRIEYYHKRLEYLAAHPCIDCGEDDPVVLEFDHRDENAKTYNVAQMCLRGHSWESILEEIRKCDVRCANCHRRKTATQFGWYAFIGEDAA